jgi:hypothetical protein
MYQDTASTNWGALLSVSGAHGVIAGDDDFILSKTNLW